MGEEEDRRKEERKFKELEKDLMHDYAIDLRSDINMEKKCWRCGRPMDYSKAEGKWWCKCGVGCDHD